MNKSEQRRRINQDMVLADLGFTTDEADSLRRISMQLRRWYERECNGEIERDEETGKVFARNLYTMRKYKTADRETGALKRLATIMARHPELSYYVQTDPRGASLYILRPGDVPEGQKAESYYTRGICVY